MRWSPFVVAIALSAAPLPAFAQSDALTLDDAITRALAESHRVAELRARGKAAEAAVQGREASSLPLVSLQGGYTRTNHVDPYVIPQPGGIRNVIYPDIPDNYRSRLDVSWPLYTGGRNESLARAARAEASAVSNDLVSVEADLRLEVTRAYWNAVTAAQTVSVVQQSLERLNAHIKDLRARLDAGLIPPNDVLSAEAQRSRQEVQVIEARNGSELALADLRRLIGADPGVPFQLTTPLESASAEPSADLGAQIAAAKNARPERAALVQRIDAAVSRVEAAGSTRKPAVAVNGGVDYAKPNPRIFPRVDEWNESWDVSVNATWLLWDAGRRSAEVAEASANQSALQARLADFDSLVELEVRQRRLDLEANRAAVRAAGDGVRSATEARRVVGERFAAGVATSTDVLEAQVALLQADLDQTRAMAGVRLAEARLARALGQ
ncbi:MAG: TolC family protein [Acidobacteriota bacterium]